MTICADTACPDARVYAHAHDNGFLLRQCQGCGDLVTRRTGDLLCPDCAGLHDTEDDI